MIDANQELYVNKRNTNMSMAYVMQPQLTATDQIDVWHPLTLTASTLLSC